MTAGILLIPWEPPRPHAFIFKPLWLTPWDSDRHIAPRDLFWSVAPQYFRNTPKSTGSCIRQPSPNSSQPPAPAPISPHLVDVLHALHPELGQPRHVELPAAIGAQLDLQLLLRLLPQQVPGQRGTHHYRHSKGMMGTSSPPAWHPQHGIPTAAQGSVPRLPEQP